MAFSVGTRAGRSVTRRDAHRLRPAGEPFEMHPNRSPHLTALDLSSLAAFSQQPSETAKVREDRERTSRAHLLAARRAFLQVERRGLGYRDPPLNFLGDANHTEPLGVFVSPARGRLPSTGSGAAFATRRAPFPLF